MHRKVNVSNRYLKIFYECIRCTNRKQLIQNDRKEKPGRKKVNYYQKGNRLQYFDTYISGIMSKTNKLYYCLLSFFGGISVFSRLG